MTYKTLIVMSASLLVSLPAGARAQDRFTPEKRINFSFGGGYTAPNSEVRDHLGDGYNFNIGLQVNITPVMAVEGLYSFNGLGSKRIAIPVAPLPVGTDAIPTDFFGDMNMQYFTTNFVVQKPQGTGTFRPYGLTGMGVYYRPIKVTTPSVGWVPGYCDPYWYVCFPGGFVETDRIVGERSSTDFGMNFGGGVNIGVIYAELRYHYIWGPEVEVPANLDTGVPESRKANGQFLVTTFGVRF
jgi:opacity protein-like surface antigen